MSSESDAEALRRSQAEIDAMARGERPRTCKDCGVKVTEQISVYKAGEGHVWVFPDICPKCLARRRITPAQKAAALNADIRNPRMEPRPHEVEDSYPWPE